MDAAASRGESCNRRERSFCRMTKASDLLVAALENEGVGLTTLGPGALNLTTAAAYAHLGAMPMVMITGQKAIRSSRQARFQIVDIVATMRPLTKMATQIVSAQ